MSQGDVARHGRAEGKGDAECLKLACRMTMCLGTGVLKDKQSLHVARVMCLGMRVPKAKGCRRQHKACIF
ncbi:unnamed protein product [Prunus armeniaca]